MVCEDPISALQQFVCEVIGQSDGEEQRGEAMRSDGEKRRCPLVTKLTIGVIRCLIQIASSARNGCKS